MSGVGSRCAAVHRGRDEAGAQARGTTNRHAQAQEVVRALQRTLGNRRLGDVLQPSTAGRPLDADTLASVEARFGRSFEQVRVHDDEPARAAADQLDARAFTFGNDIFFAAGEFVPGTGAGDRLLHHELAHVVQQGRGGAQPPALDPAAPEEHAAERVAQSPDSGATAVEGATGVGIARQARGTGNTAAELDQLRAFLRGLKQRQDDQALISRLHAPRPRSDASPAPQAPARHLPAWPDEHPQTWGERVAVSHLEAARADLDRFKPGTIEHRIAMLNDQAAEAELEAEREWNWKHTNIGYPLVKQAALMAATGPATALAAVRYGLMAISAIGVGETAAGRTVSLSPLSPSTFGRTTPLHGSERFWYGVGSVSGLVGGVAGEVRIAQTAGAGGVAPKSVPAESVATEPLSLTEPGVKAPAPPAPVDLELPSASGRGGPSPTGPSIPQAILRGMRSSYVAYKLMLGLQEGAPGSVAGGLDPVASTTAIEGQSMAGHPVARGLPEQPTAPSVGAVHDVAAPSSPPLTEQATAPAPSPSAPSGITSPSAVSPLSELTFPGVSVPAPGAPRPSRQALDAELRKQSQLEAREDARESRVERADKGARRRDREQREAEQRQTVDPRTADASAGLRRARAIERQAAAPTATSMSPESKRVLLAKYERALRQAGRDQLEINVAFGALNERLLTPSAARLAGTDQPTYIAGSPELPGQDPARLPKLRRSDLAPAPGHRRRPDYLDPRSSKTIGGRAPVVELKGNRLDRISSRRAVDLARQHAAEQEQKQPELATDQPQTMRYTFAPDPATQLQMARTLLSPTSPFKSVTFGDRKWTRADLTPP